MRISQKLNAINPESIRSCDSRTNPNSLQSKSKTSGLSSASRKKTNAELLFQQSQEQATTYLAIELGKTKIFLSMKIPCC